MEGNKVIQQLLRPLDTCVFVAQGYLLGLPNPAHRLFAVVKHEGSEQHALFLFEVDVVESPPRIAVDQFFAIKGSFQAHLKAIRSARCQIMLDNGEGSFLMLQMPYETNTAQFLEHLTRALHTFLKSPSADSPTAFNWLQGYEACRSGWDRFSKPGRQLATGRSKSPSPLIEFGDSPGDEEENMPLRTAFPETWPWSHIITPNSDGSTEVAKCETLEDFDPLYKKKEHSSSHLDMEELRERLVSVSITNATPENSPKRDKANFFPSSDYSQPNPFVSSPSPTHSEPSGAQHSRDIRHCISDSNLLKLQRESSTLNRLEPLITRSEEDLTSASEQTSGDETNLARHGSDSCLINECLLYDVDDRSPSDQGSPSDSGDVTLTRDSGLDINCGIEEKEYAKEVPSDKKPVLNKRLRPTSSLDAGLSSGEEESDYKNPRVRSTEGSPRSKRRSDTVTKFRNRLDFLAPSSSKPSVSKVNMNSPELSSKSRRGRSRDRSASRPLASPVPMRNTTRWISRYRPGVSVPTDSPRECIVQAELRQKEKEFCTSQQLRVFCGTWNVNGKSPPFNLDPFLLEYEGTREEKPKIPHIYAIAFQELDLSAQCLVSNESTREELWTNSVEITLRKAGNYQRLCSVRLVGIFLLVYIQQELLGQVSDVDTEMVPTGMHGLLGNKGGVAARFNLFHSSICFVNAHLSAQVEEVEKRNQDFHSILDKMAFTRIPEYAYSILEHDMVFWIGDLNYRIQTTPEMTVDLVRAHADTYQIQHLLKYDQLLQEKKEGNIFDSFSEGEIDFKPTYKYDPNTDTWDSSEKHRAPAWCDRILYYGKGFQLKGYQSHPKMMTSDHKPVSAIFDATMRVVIPEKEREVLEQITWKLDKLENDTLPQVDLNRTEFVFKDVKFMVPQTRRLVVTNTGQRPVHVSFIPKLDDTAYCKPWLEIKPSSAVIQPLEDVMMTLTLLVDGDSAPALNSSLKVEDILVLHLEKGKDFFISIAGNYLPSCFGSCLETLVHLHTYIREIPVAQLLEIDMTSSWDHCVVGNSLNTTAGRETPPPHDIPKELYQMVDFLNRHGLQEEDLFTDGGRPAEMEEIRDLLDTGGSHMPGTAPSVAAALLQFLEALAEPVVPTTLHQKCMDGCNNVTLCKQILMQMPKVHRRAFVFLVTLMKNFLTHSEVNKLDPKVLATIFGEVLLRPSAAERKAKTKRVLASMNRKKATFIYQFLVNDLTNPYH